MCVRLHRARHVKDSRRCGEIQWWACFITSHIETNLCPFTWRTASYSLTKLASCCGVRGPPQTHTHTHSHRGRYRQSRNIMYFFSLPPPFHATLTCITACPVPHLHTHTHTLSPTEGSTCMQGQLWQVACFVSEACRPPPCEIMWHRSEHCSNTWPHFTIHLPLM